MTWLRRKLRPTKMPACANLTRRPLSPTCNKSTKKSALALRSVSLKQLTLGARNLPKLNKSTKSNWSSYNHNTRVSARKSLKRCANRRPTCARWSKGCKSKQENFNKVYNSANKNTQMRRQDFKTRSRQLKPDTKQSLQRVSKTKKYALGKFLKP